MCLNIILPAALTRAILIVFFRRWCFSVSSFLNPVPHANLVSVLSTCPVAPVLIQDLLFLSPTMFVNYLIFFLPLAQVSWLPSSSTVSRRNGALLVWESPVCNKNPHLLKPCVHEQLLENRILSHFCLPNSHECVLLMQNTGGKRVWEM